MTEAQKAVIASMMANAQQEFAFFYSHETKTEEAINATQAYASCLIVLQLDRIATALERPVPNYDPHVSTALNRIAQATEGLESVLPRQ